jgi:hypothetical protein
MMAVRCRCDADVSRFGCRSRCRIQMSDVQISDFGCRCQCQIRDVSVSSELSLYNLLLLPLTAFCPLLTSLTAFLSPASLAY